MKNLQGEALRETGIVQDLDSERFVVVQRLDPLLTGIVREWMS